MFLSSLALPPTVVSELYLGYLGTQYMYVLNVWYVPKWHIITSEGDFMLDECSDTSKVKIGTQVNMFPINILEHRDERSKVETHLLTCFGWVSLKIICGSHGRKRFFSESAGTWHCFCLLFFGFCPVVVFLHVFVSGLVTLLLLYFRKEKEVFWPRSIILWPRVEAGQVRQWQERFSLTYYLEKCFLSISVLHHSFLSRTCHICLSLSPFLSFISLAPFIKIFLLLIYYTYSLDCPSGKIELLKNHLPGQ